MDLQIIAEKYLKLDREVSELKHHTNLDFQMELLYALSDEIISDLDINENKEEIRRVLVSMFLLGEIIGQGKK